MENKGIIDFLQRLQSAVNGKSAEKNSENDLNKTNDAQNAADNSTANKNAQNIKEYSAKNIGEKARNVPPQNAKNGEPSLFLSDEKSYAKTYNPFCDALSPKPQVAAPRAKKQPKEKIDLSTAKNLASEKRTEASKNMLELINKHNRLSRELKNRK